MNMLPDEKNIQLPKPVLIGDISVEEALSKRKSVRIFSTKAVGLSELSQILWAAQGVTRDWGSRTAPSAGALYPLELFVVLSEGVFQYAPAKHQLLCLSRQDVIKALSKAALGQRCISEAPAIIVIAAVYERIEIKYGARAERYVKMEAGHAAQNILLQVLPLGMGAVPVGAFHDDQAIKVLGLPSGYTPLYLIPVGYIM
jgi:SagB-type dehydrogenase family enzyme